MTDACLDTLMAPKIVLNELDEFARQWDIMRRQEKENWRCRRNKARRKFRTRCDIWYFENHGTLLKHVEAQTRNLSERGLGLIARTVLHLSSPIEVRIEAPGRPPTYLGGVVVFCRYATQGFHEVGITLKSHGHIPIFSEGIPGVVHRVSWAMEAMRRQATQSGAGKRLAHLKK